MATANKSKVTKKPSKLTKAGSKRKFNKLVIVAGVAVVALVGVMVVRYTKAAACEYAYCWGPYQFKGATSGSVVSKSNGLIFWDSAKDNDGRVYVDSSINSGTYYCVDTNGTGAVSITAKVNGVVTNQQSFRLQKNQCMYVGPTKSPRSINVQGYSVYDSKGKISPGPQVFRLYRSEGAG